MKYKVTLNGRVYEVEVEQGKAILAAEYDAAAPVAAPAPVAAVAAPVAAAPVAAAAPAQAISGGEVVAAPLPGVVVSIKVEAGQAVKSGQLLILIEAMKMENEVLAPHDGVVKQIVTRQDATVNTGDPLIVLA